MVGATARLMGFEVNHPASSMFRCSVGCIFVLGSCGATPAPGGPGGWGAQDSPETCKAGFEGPANTKKRVGVQWISMDINGYQWISMDTRTNTPHKTTT